MFRVAASSLAAKLPSRSVRNQRFLTKTSFLLPDPSEDKGFQLSKIVATIGPTSEQREPLLKVVDAGMKIMRLNFSHATTEEVELRTTNLALAQKDLQPDGASDLQNTRAVLLDTKGPEIRTGKLANDDSGHETVRLTKGESITLFNDPARQEKDGSTAESLYIDYPGLDRCMSQGMKVLLDDGAIILSVESVSPGLVECKIDNTGDLRSRAGVNLPFADTSDLPAMSEKDKADIKYGMSMDIDYVAASFVQTAEGVREIRKHIAQSAKDLGWDASKPLPLIISKIETALALQDFDEILEESDAIMVARGDLGVEIPLTQVTNAQKEMVAACNGKGKPVIVATQMLESMGKNPRPTRAEVADVTNAIYDGADCVMLSGETAKGKYPTESVKTMNEIITASERYASRGALGNPHRHSFDGGKSSDAAVARAAVSASQDAGCSAILLLAQDDKLPTLVSALRPSVPIFTFCQSSKSARRLQIYRGIHPVVDSSIAAKDVLEVMTEVKAMGYVSEGDGVVTVSADGDSSNVGIIKVP